jgi:hypothetical protein
MHSIKDLLRAEIQEHSFEFIRPKSPTQDNEQANSRSNSSEGKALRFKVTLEEIIFDNKKCRMIIGNDITKVLDNIRL